MFSLFPNLTKKVPMILAIVHTPAIDKGYIIIFVVKSPVKNIEAKTIVATTVTT